MILLSWVKMSKTFPFLPLLFCFFVTLVPCCFGVRQHELTRPGLEAPRGSRAGRHASLVAVYDKTDNREPNKARERRRKKVSGWRLKRLADRIRD